MEQEQETEPTPTPKIILKTGANVNVTFSSDEEGPGGLSSIQEEESSEAPKSPTQSQPTQSQPTPLKFSMPIPKQEEEPVAMDFESALGMLKKNKELKKGRFQKYSRFDSSSIFVRKWVACHVNQTVCLTSIKGQRGG